MVNFAGWSTDKAIDYTNAFEVEYNDDGSLRLVSKETFTHDEEDGKTKFEYKLVLNCVDLGAYSCGNSITIEMMMMPLPKYWHPTIVMNTARLYGWENEPMEKLIEMFSASDACDGGCVIKLAEDSVDYVVTDDLDDDYYYDILECQEAVDKLNAAASIATTVNNLRGFALDRAWNMIGSTGWDSLNHILFNDDLLRPAVDRYMVANS